MAAEFSTVAEWTAQVALDLGPDYYIPAGCRGSGSPAALDWLIEQMRLTPDDILVDCGAGVGGPAAYAAQARSIEPLLVEPEAGACRAAMALFDHPVIRGDGSALPFGDAAVDAAWSLGVLCTTADQFRLLDELRRTVRVGGRIGLLTFVAHRALPANQLADNNFPTRRSLSDLFAEVGLAVEHSVCTADLPEIPAAWHERVEAVSTALADRHGGTEAWQLAERQSTRIAELLAAGTLTGELLVLRHTTD
jgi:SAM-dependent methyltransferase